MLTTPLHQRSSHQLDLPHPHTEACTPRELLLPHTPLLAPHPRPTLASWLAGVGLEAADVDRSSAPASSALGAKP